MAGPKKQLSREPVRGYHHGNLRAALIEAGLELIQEKGAAALTLREIGARVGVSRMAAYRHFANKESLIAAIGELGFQQFADALAAARDKAPRNFAGRLTAMGHAYVRFASEHPAHYEVMFNSFDQEHEEKSWVEAGKRAFGILEQTVREGQRAGEVREGDSVALARVLWAMVHGISTLGLDGNGASKQKPSAFMKLCSEVLRLGLEPR